MNIEIRNGDVKGIWSSGKTLAANDGASSDIRPST
jgi:hypothetical protein